MGKPKVEIWCQNKDTMKADMSKKMKRPQMHKRALIYICAIYFAGCTQHHEELDSRVPVSGGTLPYTDKTLSFGETSLHMVAHCQFQEPNLKVMQELIRGGADVNAKDDFGRTPLHVCRDVQAARLLVENGADLEVVDNNGFTPLDSVCNEAARLSVWEHDDIDWITDVAEFLLMKGASFSDKFNLDILESKRLILLVLKHGGEIDRPFVPRLQFCGMRNPDVIKFLVDAGYGDVDAIRDGRTALHIAVEYGWPETVKALLECGATVHIKDYTGKTPIDVTPVANRQEIRALLKKAPEHPDKYQRTVTAPPICSIEELQQKMKNPRFDINSQYAWIKNPGYEFIERQKLINVAAIRNDLPYLKFLIAHGAHFKPKKGKHGRGLQPYEDHPLIHTTTPQMAEYLLQKGVGIDERGPYGNTLLILSTTKCDFEMVKFCLEHGADVDAVGHVDGSWKPTALQVACLACRGPDFLPGAYKHEPSEKYLAIVRLLVEHGADVNKANPDGETTLSHAVESGNLQCIEYLLRHGAKMEKATRSPQTIWQLAAHQKNSKEITELLQKWGKH
ncbi:MAG: ankyrin repeat domain-containing protein [Holosporales bacterium]|jgi:ankyrin repeat protein|nr:ankyrin repeat domain-containing protein [Holosporales bacterium]